MSPVEMLLCVPMVVQRRYINV